MSFEIFSWQIFIHWRSRFFPLLKSPQITLGKLCNVEVDLTTSGKLSSQLQQELKYTITYPGHIVFWLHLRKYYSFSVWNFVNCILFCPFSWEEKPILFLKYWNSFICKHIRQPHSPRGTGKTCETPDLSELFFNGLLWSGQQTKWIQAVPILFLPASPSKGLIKYRIPRLRKIPHQF